MRGVVTLAVWKRIIHRTILASVQKRLDANRLFRGPYFVVGPTGVGKSQSIFQAWRDANAELGADTIDLVYFHGSQFDPSDIAGIYVFDPEKKKVVQVPNDRWRLDSGRPAIYAGDEFNRTSQATKRALLELPTERTIGGKPIHEASIVCLMGNPEAPGYDVDPTDFAEDTRFSWLDVQYDHKGWKAYMIMRQAHPWVMGWAGMKSETICPKIEDRDSGQHGRPCPRSWDRVSQALWTFGEEEARPVVEGLLGAGLAKEFYAFGMTAMRYQTLVDDILKGDNKTADALDAQFFVNACLVDRFRQAQEVPVARRILDYARVSADKAAEASSVLVEDLCGVNSDVVNSSDPEWTAAVRRLREHLTF